MRKPCASHWVQYMPARHVEPLERGVLLWRDLGLGLPGKGVGNVLGRDGQALVVERDRVLRHGGAVDGGRDEPQVAPVEAQVERTLAGAGGVAAEGYTRPDAGGGRIEHEGELDGVGEIGRRPIVGEPDRRGLGVDAHAHVS